MEYSEFQQKISEIEAEMKRAGYWRDEPLPPAAYSFSQPFAMDTMTFSEWLQFVLIPRVQSLIVEQGQFPTRSMVGAQAVREFDGDTNANHLVELLCEFDGLF